MLQLPHCELLLLSGGPIPSGATICKIINRHILRDRGALWRLHQGPQIKTGGDDGIIVVGPRCTAFPGSACMYVSSGYEKLWYCGFADMHVACI